MIPTASHMFTTGSIALRQTLHRPTCKSTSNLTTATMIYLFRVRVYYRLFVRDTAQE